MPHTIIGVDCATKPKRVGCALATFDGGRTVVEKIQCCSQTHLPADVIAKWLRNCSEPALIALDAPLGWPKPLGDMLATHQAGQAPEADAHALFRRATDLFVRKHLGKQPLDVGADRIARTAHAALQLLDDVRRKLDDMARELSEEDRRLGYKSSTPLDSQWTLDEEIPLAWSPSFTGLAAIEVYPAATLVTHRLPSSGYKRSPDTERRREIITGMDGKIELPDDRDLLVSNADVLDAVVCVLTAHDFLTGQGVEPLDRELAEQEGWIWFRKPGGDDVTVDHSA